MNFLLFDLPLLAQSGGLSWTPVTYYVLCGVVQLLVILGGFRLMGVDPEQNGFIGALIATVIINVLGYFLRDAGVVGALIVGGSTFAVLAGVTSGEVLKAFFMTSIVFASYAGIGTVVFPRTPLEVDDVGGFTRIVMTGGLEPEPINEETNEKLINTGIEAEE